MNKKTSVKGSREGNNKENKHDRLIINRLLFASAFISLIIATFFVYDIVLFAIENNGEENSAEAVSVQEAVPEIVTVHPSITHEYVDNMVVSYNTAFLAHLSVDGKYYTDSFKTDENATVLSLLERHGISLGEDDKINYSTDTQLEPDMIVEIGRTHYEIETETVKVPFKTIEIPVVYASSSSGVGKNSSGANGIKEIKTRIKYVDGVKVDSSVVSEEVVKQPVSAVKYVNSASALDKGNGVPSDYEAVLNCKFTAYSPGDDGGSRTYTGHPAQVGYVAVDPNVIPLHSKLYIVTDSGFVYGYAYAMDTGGAIKGNKVDLFLPSKEDANQFGVKTGKVYIVAYGN